MLEDMNVDAKMVIRIYMDGNSWCVLSGDDLEDGVAGFGDTVAEAIKDFSNNMEEYIGTYNLDNRHEIVRRRRLREEVDTLYRSLNKHEEDYDIVDAMIRELRDDQIGIVRVINDTRRLIEDKEYDIRYGVVKSAMMTGLAAGKVDALDDVYSPSEGDDEFVHEFNHWYDIGWNIATENNA